MKQSSPQQIRIEAYDYPLSDERIAKYPLVQRDQSKLLVHKNGDITQMQFRDIMAVLPPKSTLVFNNTKVIQARLLFRKETGARIEIFCLEPAVPHDYILVFQQREECSWHCLIGNSKKWKDGALRAELIIDGKAVSLSAERASDEKEAQLVMFKWDDPSVSFADILAHFGVLPIPPYLNRDTEQSDIETYQTVYSKIEGSVAAPTAGLHFTPDLISSLQEHGTRFEEVTLHIGAGTFKPVKSETIEGHTMHSEFISVNKTMIERLLKTNTPIIAVGTTSVRTLESLYYLGVMVHRNPNLEADELIVPQWMPYDAANNTLTRNEALQALLDHLESTSQSHILAATRIIIATGYDFKIVQGIVTNFHQPKSTLLLLISAFIGSEWRKIYDYALENDFRFLSYGDSSLLLR